MVEVVGGYNVDLFRDPIVVAARVIRDLFFRISPYWKNAHSKYARGAPNWQKQKHIVDGAERKLIQKGDNNN